MLSSLSFLLLILKRRGPLRIGPCCFYVVEAKMQIPLLRASQRQCLLNGTRTPVLHFFYFFTAPSWSICHLF